MSTIDSQRAQTRCESLLRETTQGLFSADEKMSLEVPSSSLAVMSSKWMKLEIWGDLYSKHRRSLAGVPVHSGQRPARSFPRSQLFVGSLWLTLSPLTQFFSCPLQPKLVGSWSSRDCRRRSNNPAVGRLVRVTTVMSESSMTLLCCLRFFFSFFVSHPVCIKCN